MPAATVFLALFLLSSIASASVFVVSITECYSRCLDPCMVSRGKRVLGDVAQIMGLKSPKDEITSKSCFKNIQNRVVDARNSSCSFSTQSFPRYQANPAQDECVYVLYVETGSVESSGTNAKISVVIGDKHGGQVTVDNLESWGLMGDSYDYFEKGNIDSFGGRGSCLNGPVCFLNLTSDNSGSYPSWYCDVVEVTSTGPHEDSYLSIFHIDQWLSKDRKPYQLSTQRNLCSEIVGGGKHGVLSGRKLKISAAASDQ